MPRALRAIVILAGACIPWLGCGAPQQPATSEQGSSHVSPEELVSFDATPRAPGDVLRVRVVDEAGRPVAGARIHHREARYDEYDAWPDVSGADGVAVVPVAEYLEPGEALDLVVSCSGRRSVVVRGASSSFRVVLRPARPIPVRVRWSADSTPPTPPERLTIWLEWWNPDGSDDPRRVELDPDALSMTDRVAEFVVDDPGTYLVGFSADALSTELPGFSSPEEDADGGISLMRFLLTEPSSVQVVAPEGGSGEVEVRILADESRRR